MLMGGYLLQTDTIHIDRYLIGGTDGFTGFPLCDTLFHRVGHLIMLLFFFCDFPYLKIGQGRRYGDVLSDSIYIQGLQLSGYEDKLFSGVVFTGGGANLKNIEEPFRMAFQEAGALGVMSSYNDYDGEPITGSYQLSSRCITPKISSLLLE